MKKSYKEVKQMNIKKVVDDQEWQELRQSFIGKWTNQEGLNIKKLWRYLGRFNDPLRVRRVLNYLTGSGFRMNRIGRSEDCQFLLKVVRSVYKEEGYQRKIINGNNLLLERKFNIAYLEQVINHFKFDGSEIEITPELDVIFFSPENKISASDRLKIKRMVEYRSIPEFVKNPKATPLK